MIKTFKKIKWSHHWQHQINCIIINVRRVKRNNISDIHIRVYIFDLFGVLTACAQTNLAIEATLIQFSCDRVHI